MRTQNILASIEIMKRAEAANSLSMFKWQTVQPFDNPAPTVTTEAELHQCGNKACFAGHIAVSPEFKADGGSCVSRGSPAYRNEDGWVVNEAESAIGRWLGVDNDVAWLLIYNISIGIDKNDLRHPVYGVHWKDVQPKHIITALKELMMIGDTEFFEKYAP